MRPAAISTFNTNTGEAGSCGCCSMNSLIDTDGRNAGRVQLQTRDEHVPGVRFEVHVANRTIDREGLSVTRRLTRRSESGR